MNAAYQNLQEGNLFQGSLRRFHVAKDMMVFLMLIAVMLSSAVCVIYVKNYERQLFTDIQHMHARADKLEVEWGQLLLEQSTWSTPARVQSIAEERFAMRMPHPSEIIMVRL